MTSRRLVALDAGPGALASWVQAVGPALDGSGPALAPMPPGRDPQRSRLESAMAAGESGAPLESDQVALVVPTSGSTGTPKGAMLTGAALRSSAAATNAWIGGAGRWVLALPLTHVAGLMVVVRAVEAGCAPWDANAVTGFDTGRFAEATTAAAARARSDGLPLYTSLVPTQLLRLLDAPGGPRALAAYDAILVGAAATPATLLDRAAAAQARIVTTYGMSETCGGCVYDGRPLDGVVVELDPTGRVVIGGPTLFLGYRLRPDLTAAALDGQGRLVTADRGRIDDQGRLRIIGRADDVIITGGEKVAPAQVEDALATLPGVRSTVVVGVPDRRWGERVVAVVVPREGQTVGLDEVRAALAGVLPAPALPREVLLVDALPMLASGKPDRAGARTLAERCAAEPAGHAEPSGTVA
jgi:O-succinylbenzoic acid--CoA ligase